MFNAPFNTNPFNSMSDEQLARARAIRMANDPSVRESIQAAIVEVEAKGSLNVVLDAATTSGSPDQEPPRQSWLPSLLISIIDCALEPEAADPAIGDLLQHMHRRRDRGRNYLIWYMAAQTCWILVNRTFDLISCFYKARAGK